MTKQRSNSDPATPANLPPDLLLQILTNYLTNDSHPQDLASCALVSHSWHQTTLDPVIWKTLCVRRFGCKVTDSSLARNKYGEDYKRMYIEDARTCAVPTLDAFGTSNYYDPHTTLHFPRPSYYRYNQPLYYFCGLVVSIQWHRPRQVVKVHIEARGEVDLRHPKESTVRWQGGGANANVCPRNLPGLEQVEFRGRTATGLWIPGNSKAGHFKGCLEFPEQTFARPGPYQFCYANRLHSHGDYAPVLLLEVPEVGGLAAAFALPQDLDENGNLGRTGGCPFAASAGSAPVSSSVWGSVASTLSSSSSGCPFAAAAGARQIMRAHHPPSSSKQGPRQYKYHYTLNESPFANDTPDVELARWRGVVGNEVLHRHEGERRVLREIDGVALPLTKWWV